MEAVVLADVVRNVTHIAELVVLMRAARVALHVRVNVFHTAAQVVEVVALFALGLAEVNAKGVQDVMDIVEERVKAGV